MTTNSIELLPDIDERYVINLLKESVAQDKKRENEYRTILEDQVKMLKEELLYKNFLINDQVSIIKNLFILNEKTNTRELANVETGPIQSRVEDINNSKILPNDNNRNDLNSDSDIINYNVANTRDSLEDALAIKNCYINYDDDAVFTNDHIVNSSWITVRNKNRKVHYGNKSNATNGYESPNRFAELNKSHDSEVNNWDTTMDDESDNNYLFQPALNRSNVKVNKRPNVIVQNNPENNISVRKHKHLEFGVHTFAEVTTYGKKNCVFGNSIPAKLNMKSFNNNLHKAHAYKKIFGCATAKHETLC